MRSAVARTYLPIPDRSACYHPGCSWHQEGDDAETLAEAHALSRLHETRVTTTAVVIFGRHAPHPAEAMR